MAFQENARHRNREAWSLVKGIVMTGRQKRPRGALNTVVTYRVTAKVQTAIEAMVYDGMPRAAAAKLAGLSARTMRKVLNNNPAARSFHDDRIRFLKHCARPRAMQVLSAEGVLAPTFSARAIAPPPRPLAKIIHALIADLESADVALRVAAARAILQEEIHVPYTGPRMPGFTIHIIEARSRRYPPTLPRLASAKPFGGVGIELL